MPFRCAPGQRHEPLVWRKWKRCWSQPTTGRALGTPGAPVDVMFAGWHFCRRSQVLDTKPKRQKPFVSSYGLFYLQFFSGIIQGGVKQVEIVEMLVLWTGSWCRNKNCLNDRSSWYVWYLARFFFWGADFSCVPRRPGTPRRQSSLLRRMS